MSAGWEVGDMALCLTNTDAKLGTTKLLRMGALYTVTGIYVSSVCGSTGLILAEAKPCKNPGFHAFLFRKIKPDQHEGCEPEFVTLLNRIKVKQGETV